MIDPLEIIAILAACFVAMAVIRATRKQGGGW